VAQRLSGLRDQDVDELGQPSAWTRRASSATSSRRPWERRMSMGCSPGSAAGNWPRGWTGRRPPPWQQGVARPGPRLGDGLGAAQWGV